MVQPIRDCHLAAANERGGAGKQSENHQRSGGRLDNPGESEQRDKRLLARRGAPRKANQFDEAVLQEQCRGDDPQHSESMGSKARYVGAGYPRGHGLILMDRNAASRAQMVMLRSTRKTLSQDLPHHVRVM